jgi:hypothetical protein
MNNPLESMLQQLGMKTAAFPPGSRYHGLELALYEAPGKTPVVYVRRRIIPPAEQFEERHEYTVVEKDRLDNLAAAYLGDAEQFWQLADWNNAMEPENLTDEVGAKLRLC